MTSAKSFHQSIGVCIHPDWLDTNWGKVNWQAKVLEAGIVRVRGTVSPASIKLMKPLFDAGVQACVMPSNSCDKSQATKFLKALEPYAKNLCGIEGPNEYNGKVTDWANKLRAFMQWLHDTVRANPVFNGVPVVAPSMKMRRLADYKALGNIDAYVEKSCQHYYPDGRKPTQYSDGPLSQAISYARILSPDPIWTTEYGYQVPGPGKPLTSSNISERAQAKYTLRGLFDLFAAGSECNFIYEAMDDPGKGHWWGMGTADLSHMRMDYYAVKELLALVADDEDSSGTLDYSLSNAPADLKQYLISKSDGSFLLCLYRDVDSWDRKNKRDIEPAPVNIGISLKVSKKLELFEPTFTNSPRQSVSGMQITVPVSDHVAVVRIS